MSQIVRGWLLAEEEQAEGIEHMRQQLLAWRATGAESARPYYLALLAETYGKAGAPAAGLAVLTECWSWMDKTGGRVFEAELYRLQGELTLQQEKQKAKGKKQRAKRKPAARPVMPDAYSAAEAGFHKAIDIARRQQAKSLELRATVSLARLWRQHGKTTEARRMLAEIYNWFTEGFDTQDLQEAKALLDALE